MGLSASQARQLLLTAKRNDLEFRAQQISQQRLILTSQLEEIATEYENATSNRQMQITMYLNAPDEYETNTKTTQNLTYATLISGCSRLGMQSPLMTIPTTENDYSATTAFVLRDADGRIVVSSPDEIPGVKTYNKQTIDDTVESGKVVELDDNGDVKESEEAKTVNFRKDAEGQYVKHEDGKFVLYDKDNKDHAAKDRYSITNTVYTSEETDVTTESFVEGPNKSGTYKVNITNADGSVFSEEYVVDSMLAIGATDAYGDNSGPNYLQDCLRNGTYLLEKWTPEKNSAGEKTGNIKKTGVSWDAATGITDRYYTEDDDAAKAKYDRLQNEIQRQDKKLELELDNIETQRSAITTEEESVQKVMDDNIEGTFKTFA